MARIRSIKPEFFRHEQLFEAERETGLPLRVAYSGLWTACDREGRFVWSPRQLKLDCLPYDEVDFARVLDALWTRGFIEKYVVEGKEFGFVPSWNEHQIINNREMASRLPEPNENNILTRDGRVMDASNTREGNYQAEGKGRERKGMEVGTRQDASEDAWTKFKQEYPSRGEAPQPWKPAREKFNRAIKSGVDPYLIIRGACGYRGYAQRSGIIGTEKVAQAVTWLNQERWEQYSAKLSEPEVVDWDEAVAAYRRTNGVLWPYKKLGPAPDSNGCNAPVEILQKYQYGPGQLRLVPG